MKKLVSLTLALVLGFSALLLPAMAEETHTVKLGVLSIHFPQFRRCSK